MICDEGDLRFDFTKAVRAKRFDDKAQHGLTHCMKAVDFILETKDAYYFVEVKDPDNPNAKNKAAFISKLTSGELNKNLTGKYRDTLIYRWAENALSMPVHYVVLLCMQSLDAAALLARTEELRRNLPLNSPVAWKQPIAKSCVILSLNDWNRHFKQWPVSRISAA